ncbi:MAG: hypothetical protein F4210_03965 [Holophagales bacterium]|nr:hypothetical protein [Holophagales bacterium]MYF94661.1 hypothetical protein [Holophagales bacterium]
MKRTLVALALCALPAATFAQNVVCHACDHVAPYFRGEGGFIATVAEGADEVVFVASCGNVSITGEVATGGGTVAQLFTWRNGLACDADDGSLEIAGVEDGGWYWITDDMNSAVGSLVSKDILDNETTDITSAGEAVSMTMGQGAVFLKEARTGRVGILPNILPEAPAPEPAKCGYNDRGSSGTSATATADQANARYTRRVTDCALGDGGTITLATTTNSFTGATTMVADKATLVRPAGTAEAVVTIDLWGNHSGFFTTAANGHALLGQPSVATSELRGIARLTGVTYTATRGSGPRAEDAGTAGAGITMDTTTTANVVTFTIVDDDAYCSDDNNHPVTVSVTALMADAASAAQTTPSRTRATSGTVGRVGATSFTVVCP